MVELLLDEWLFEKVKYNDIHLLLQPDDKYGVGQCWRPNAVKPVRESGF